MAKEIFISYSRKDFDKVKAIKDEIDRELGIDCWMDLDGIESGQQFEDVIISAINGHDTMLFMLSPNSMNSEWALDELIFAKMKRKRVVLLFIEPCQMTDKFWFKYNKYDSIEWDNQLQHEKLIHNLHKWFSDSVQHKKSFQELAEDGDTKSQVKLGDKYYKGDGVPKDYTKAVYWYRKAAERGDAKAQYNLGSCYYNGEGVDKDYAKAVYWFTKAAEQGNTSAQCNLGACYHNGEGVAQDYAKMEYWLTKAAEQGYTRAQNTLGYFYKYGIGVDQDDAKAEYWYSKAAEQKEE